MIAHQKIIRDSQVLKQKPNLFGKWWEEIDKDLLKTEVKRISFKTAEPIILEHEWIGTMPLPKSCRFMYGIYFEGNLGGVVVYVEPSTRQFNEKYPRQVIQLNRGACVFWTPKNTATRLISQSLKDLKREGIKIIIAYCTQEAGEIGTIYQALGWDYVGDTAESNVYYLDNHWVSERTLADKKTWAKNKDKRWLESLNNLPFKKLKPKLKYVKLIGDKKENEKIRKEFEFYPLPYRKRI